MNLSQHCFMPLEQKIVGGYYNASGQFVSNASFNNSPLSVFPSFRVVNHAICFNNTNVKMRVWTSSVSPTQQNQTQFSPSVGSPFDISVNFRLYSIPDVSGMFDVNCLMFKIY